MTRCDCSVDFGHSPLCEEYEEDIPKKDGDAPTNLDWKAQEKDVKACVTLLASVTAALASAKHRIEAVHTEMDMCVPIQMQGAIKYAKWLDRELLFIEKAQVSLKQANDSLASLWGSCSGDARVVPEEEVWDESVQGVDSSLCP